MTDKEHLKAIIKQYADKGERLFLEASESNESFAESYWDGYKDCADGLLRELEDMQEEKSPMFKVGDKVRYKYNNICTKPRVIAKISGLSHYVDTDGQRMDMAYTDANFKLVEENESRYPSFEESQGECHPFQDIALNG